MEERRQTIITVDFLIEGPTIMLKVYQSDLVSCGGLSHKYPFWATKLAPLPSGTAFSLVVTNWLCAVT